MVKKYIKLMKKCATYRVDAFSFIEILIVMCLTILAYTAGKYIMLQFKFNVICQFIDTYQDINTQEKVKMYGIEVEFTADNKIAITGNNTELVTKLKAKYES